METYKYLGNAGYTTQEAKGEHGHVNIRHENKRS